MKNKKLLLIATAALGVVALGTAGVSTMAWYSASSSTAQDAVTPTSTLTASDKSEDLGGITFEIAASSGFSSNDQLVITNRTGRSYYKAGTAAPTQILASDFDTGDNHKQGTTTWDVKIKKTSGTYGQVTKDLLAESAGTYYINVTAGGKLKLSLTKTAALTTTSGGATATDDDSSKVNFATSTNMAYGALGAAASASVDVLKVVISDAGVVTCYKVSNVTAAEVITWDSGAEYTLANIQAGTAYVSSPVYYGLEVTSADAMSVTDINTASTGSIMTPDLTDSLAHTA